MVANRSDLELVSEVKNGFEDSFELLTERYAKKVYGMVFHLVKNKEDAEEVLQDVFVTVYRKIQSFEGKSSFASWLYRVAVNSALMKIRKRAQEQSVAIDDVEVQATESQSLDVVERQMSDEVAIRCELMKKLKLAIRYLPDAYRVVFVMRDISGFTNKEVSESLRISIATVKSRLHRSRLMLREQILDA